jgi:tetratricopeptide (TPR) repeat protein
LFLFVLLQLWIKPTPPTTPPPEPAAPSDSQLLNDARFSPTEQHTLPEVPQTRLIDPGNAPSAPLQHIQDDLDRGNYRDAETGLQKLPSKMLAGEGAKRFAAALWNNLGVQQEKFSGAGVSVKAFKQAVALAPKNSVALLNLTQAYWELRAEALTPEFLESVLLVAPDDAFSRLALADILIEQGSVVEAGRHLNLAQARANADPNLTAYFQRLSQKVSHQAVGKQTTPTPVAATPKSTPSPSVVPAEMVPKPLPPTAQTPPIVPWPPASNEGPVSGRLASRSKEQFAIQFDGRPDPETLMRIRSILEYAHEELSKKFGYSLSSPIKVVLHTGQKFTTEAGSPVGADELYDASSSTIHIPTDGAMEDLAVFSRVLRHEFVHALLDDKMRGHKDRLPTWLSEGLAIQLAEDPWPALEEASQMSSPIISLSRLEGRWDRSQANNLDLAYVESSTAVQSLVDRFGMYGIRQIMNLLQAGQSLDAAMKLKWSLSYEQFQREWTQRRAASAKKE